MLDLVVYTILPLLSLMFFSGLLVLWLLLIYHRDHHLERRAVQLADPGAWLLLTTTLLLAIRQGQAPVLNPAQLSLLLATLIWLAQQWLQRRVRQRALVLLPLLSTALLVAMALAMGMAPAQGLTSLTGPRIALHVIVPLTGIAVLIGMGVYSAGRVMLNGLIRARQFSGFFTLLPPLADLDRLRSHALALGWTLLTGGLLLSLLLRFGAAAAGLRDAAQSAGPGHLHPALLLWGGVTLVFVADRLCWFSKQVAAMVSLLVAIAVFVLLALLVMGLFAGVWA